MNLIITNIDGVINNEEGKKRGQFIDEQLMFYLNEIAEETDCYSIVISGDLKKLFKETHNCIVPNKTYMESIRLNYMLDLYGLELYDLTKDSSKDEIKNYVESNNVKDYIILDSRDLELDSDMKKRYIKVDKNKGLTLENVNEAVKKLNKNKNKVLKK